MLDEKTLQHIRSLEKKILNVRLMLERRDKAVSAWRNFDQAGYQRSPRKFCKENPQGGALNWRLEERETGLIEAYQQILSAAYGMPLMVIEAFSRRDIHLFYSLQGAYDLPVPPRGYHELPVFVDWYKGLSAEHQMFLIEHAKGSIFRDYRN